MVIAAQVTLLYLEHTTIFSFQVSVGKQVTDSEGIVRQPRNLIAFSLAVLVLLTLGLETGGDTVIVKKNALNLVNKA